LVRVLAGGFEIVVDVNRQEYRVEAGMAKRKPEVSEQESKANSKMMKEELLDIEAILSHVAAWVTIANPDIEKAKAAIEQAREKLLDLAEGLEDS
jgi:hypothetical protein